MFSDIELSQGFELIDNLKCRFNLLVKLRYTKQSKHGLSSI